jgi:hypothetical protein
MDFAERLLEVLKVVMTDTIRKYTDLNYSKDKISTYLSKCFN